MKLTKYFLALMVGFTLIMAPAPSRGGQDPWAYLDGFTPLPQSLTRIAERYVAMIYVNRDEHLVAAVFFNASCVPINCEIHHRAGFAAVNSAGSNTRVYVEPEEAELLDVIATISGEYFRGA